jgi:hypothetical protein
MENVRLRVPGTCTYSSIGPRAAGGDRNSPQVSCGRPAHGDRVSWDASPTSGHVTASVAGGSTEPWASAATELAPVPGWLDGAEGERFELSVRH